MTAQLTTVPTGYHAVTPWIIGRRTADLIDFLVEVFDGTEIGRLEADGVVQHAEVRIGDSVVMMFDSPPDWPATPAFLRHYVADDALVVRRAVDAGSTIVTEPTELAWGDRVSRFADPFGNLHWLHQRVAEPTDAETERRWQEPKFQQAMAYVQSSLFVPTR